MKKYILNFVLLTLSLSNSSIFAMKTTEISEESESESEDGSLLGQSKTNNETKITIENNESGDEKVNATKKERCCVKCFEEDEHPEGGLVERCCAKCFEKIKYNCGKGHDCFKHYCFDCDTCCDGDTCCKCDKNKGGLVERCCAKCKNNYFDKGCNCFRRYCFDDRTCFGCGEAGRDCCLGICGFSAIVTILGSPVLLFYFLLLL